MDKRQMKKDVELFKEKFLLMTKEEQLQVMREILKNVAAGSLALIDAIDDNEEYRKVIVEYSDLIVNSPLSEDAMQVMCDLHNLSVALNVAVNDAKTTDWKVQGVVVNLQRAFHGIRSQFNKVFQYRLSRDNITHLKEWKNDKRGL